MLKKYFLIGFLSVSAFLLADFKKTNEESVENPCEVFKGKHISYIKDIFFVTKACKRRKLDEVESQEVTRQGKTVHQVGKKVIQAIPREPQKEHYSFSELRPKYKDQCVTAGKVVYLVTPSGKRAYSSYDIAKTACRDKIAQVSYAELRGMPDLPGFPAPSNRYPPLKKGTTPKKIALSKACSKLQNNTFATFFSKVYKVKKDKKSCYLIEQNPLDREVRMALGEATPVDLTPSQHESIPKKKEVAGKKEKPSPKKG